MLFRVISSAIDYPENKTTVEIEIMEQVGSITRVKERLMVSLVGKLEHKTEDQYAAIILTLQEAGYDIPVFS